MYPPYERLYHLLAYVLRDHTTYFDRARRVIPLIWPYSRLFHLSNRVPGLYTLVWPKRDLFPLANRIYIYIYISIFSLSQQPIIHKTRIPFSWINSKYFAVSLLPCVCVHHTANKKGNINVTYCATCIDPPIGGGASVAFRFERKPIRFYFEKREEKTMFRLR